MKVLKLMVCLLAITIGLRAQDSSAVSEHIDEPVEKSSFYSSYNKDSTITNKGQFSLKRDKNIAFDIYKLEASSIGNIIQIILLFLQITIIFFGLRQYKENLKYSSRETIYKGFMDLEKDINESNKEIWGLSQDDTYTANNGVKHSYNLDEIKQMVLLIDLFAFERGHSKKYNFSPLANTNLLHRLFKKMKYRSYWEYVVKPNFFEESRFAIVVDATIAQIELTYGLIEEKNDQSQET